MSIRTVNFLQLHTDTQYVIINIPITEFEVTLDTPVVGGDPHKIASVAEDAPYMLDYNEKYSWVSGVSGNTGLFAGNLIPQLSVTLVPTDSIFAWVNDGGVYKVSGDYLNDSDYTNDNAVRMEETETYQSDQTYRADIYFSTTNKNYTTYFAKNVTLVVNGETCYIETLSGGSNLEGQNNAKAYYYFKPKPERQTIGLIYIDGIEQPVGNERPATSLDLRIGEEDGEVYASRLKWFCDVNKNSKLDNGEDSENYFNDDGSFIQGRKYSVYIELEARDRDGDGESDYVIIPSNVGIFITNGEYVYEMTGGTDGAVYTFPEAKVPAKAVKADTSKLVFDLTEGYDATQKTITFTSVGTTVVTSVTARSADTSLINVTSNGMKAVVTPVAGLEKGTYTTYVVLVDEKENVWHKVPVTVSVGEKINTDGISVFGDINVALQKTDTNIYAGVAELQAGTYTFRMDEFGVTLGYGGTYTDTISGVKYNASYSSATTFKATGGNYTFTYNVNTDVLKVTKA